MLIGLVIVASLLTVNPVSAPPPPPKIHAPVVIDGNGSFTEQNGVTSGNGTASDPYVIQGWTIYSLPPGVAIRNTDSYFVIRSVRSPSGIDMANVSNGRVENSQVYSGISLDNSRNMIISGGGAQQVTIDSSSNIVISQSDPSDITINSSGNITISQTYGYGIAVSSSRNITITQVEVSEIIIDSSSDFTISESTGSQTISSSDNGTLVGNRVYTSYSTLYGLYSLNIVRSTRLTVENNTLTQGITIRGDSPEQFDSNVITPDNMVNGRPLLFYKDCGGLDLDSIEVGELIVANCSQVSVTNLTSNNPDVRTLEIAFVTDAIVRNVTGNILVTNSTQIEASSNRGGIEVDSSFDVQLFNNNGSIEVDSLLDAQILNNLGLIRVSSSINISILDNRGYPYGGVAVTDSSNVTVSGETLPSCDCTGVGVENSDHVTVSNSALGADYGIIVTASKVIEISNNLISGGDTGPVILNSCSDVSIDGNQIQTVSVYSYLVEVSGCTNVNISGNTITPPSWILGPDQILLDISLSRNVVISENNLFNATTAVSISNSSGVAISENNISSNEQGVILQNTQNTLVFHNNFLNNILQAKDTNSTRNVWDNGYPSGGNFWSDYTGVDSCSGPQQNICPSPDGIGDTSYTFNANHDRYPLMKPFAPLVVATAKNDPNVISQSSVGKYLTVSIQLPVGLNVSNVVLSSIRLNCTIAPTPGVRSTVVSLNRAQVLMVKFNVTEVKTLFTKLGSYVLYLSGNTVNSVAFRPFSASTTIRVQSG